MHKAQHLVPFLAAAGLLVLTVATSLGPPAPGRDWQFLTIVLAWVAVLSNALVARGQQRVGTPPEHATLAHASPDSPTHSGASDRPTLGSMPDGVAAIKFAQELHGALETDRLHQLIARGLTRLVSQRDVFVVARFGARQHIVVPPGSNGSPRTLLTDDIRKWITFPMKVKGQPIGVIGVGLQKGELSEHEHRLLPILAEFVGQSLATVNAFEVMRETSLVDSLTGCATRAEGRRRFEAELRRADRTRISLAVLMLDLDHFKSVNDRFGHHTGDAVLSTIGDMLLKTLRASDVRCRWGGEEFLLVLTDSSPERARRACEALRHRIETTPVRSGGQTLQITASIGVTMAHPGDTDIPALLARADSALYKAKSLGRNRVEFVPDDRMGDGPAASYPLAVAQPVRPAPVEPPGRWPERRDPARADRRRIPSPGRRRTDPGVSAGEQWRA